AGCGASGGIADHAGKIADQEDNRVAQILKVFHLAKQNRMTQMQIRRCWIKSRFHDQRFAAFELLAELLFADDLLRSFFDVGKLIWDRHKCFDIKPVSLISLLFLSVSGLTAKFVKGAKYFLVSLSLRSSRSLRLIQLSKDPHLAAVHLEPVFEKQPDRLGVRIVFHGQEPR